MVLLLFILLFDRDLILSHEAEKKLKKAFQHFFSFFLYNDCAWG
jgi:hypothetical protein